MDLCRKFNELLRFFVAAQPCFFDLTRCYAAPSLTGRENGFAMLTRLCAEGNYAILMNRIGVPTMVGTNWLRCMQ